MIVFVYLATNSIRTNATEKETYKAQTSLGLLSSAQNQCDKNFKSHFFRAVLLKPIAIDKTLSTNKPCFDYSAKDPRKTMFNF